MKKQLAVTNEQVNDVMNSIDKIFEEMEYMKNNQILTTELLTRTIDSSDFYGIGVSIVNQKELYEISANQFRNQYDHIDNLLKQVYSTASEVVNTTQKDGVN